MNVDVLNESDFDVDIRRLTQLCRFAMRRMRLHPATEICVRLVDIDTITNLNSQWMGENKPTDVLSFPMDELTPGSGSDTAPEGYLGDIAISPHIAEKQAVAQNHSAMAEIELLLVHGILHLLGFDHAEPQEHAEMFGLQARLLLEWNQEGVDGETLEAIDS